MPIREDRSTSHIFGSKLRPRKTSTTSSRGDFIAAQMQVPAELLGFKHDFHGRNMKKLEQFGMDSWGHLGPNVMRIFCWDSFKESLEQSWKPCQGRQRSDRRSPQNLGLNRG
jgi:hypothetical protein